MKLRIAFLVFLPFLCGLHACKKKDIQQDTRSFYMAVTPWPAAYTFQAVDDAYAFINDHCDMISDHFDEGIPYEEAYQQTAMPLRLQQEIQNRLSKTNLGKKVFLSVAPLDITRAQKAGYSSFADNVPASIISQWEQLPVNDPKVISAYVNYVSYLADQLHPSFINYGVESNAFAWDAAAFLQYKDFISKVYQQLKQRYPSIPLFVSFMAGEDARMLNNAAALVPYTDYIAISAYPYTNVSSSANGNTDPSLFPDDYFSRYTNLAPDKPMGFAETGYAAEDLNIPSLNLNKHCTEAWQQQYLQLICNFCKEHHAKFLVWFCHQDYDALDQYFIQQGLYIDLMGIWEDMGLIHETGRKRPAYQTWLEWQQKKVE